MSWPTDGEPRFAVGSVTGWPIIFPLGPMRGGRDDGAPTTWHVYDRAYAHRLMATFKPSRWSTAPETERAARAAAAALEEAAGAPGPKCAGN